MKVFISAVLILSLLLTPTIASEAATPSITRIFLDQAPIKQASTYQLGNVLYIEAKPLLIAEGFNIHWSANNQTLQLEHKDISALLTVNSKKAVMNNKNITLTAIVLYRAESVYISVEDLATVMDKELSKSINSNHIYYKSSIKDLIYKALNDKASTYTYDVRLEQNKRSGVGKLYRDGQLLYEGDFSENELNGYGKLYNNGKLLVEGGFSANEPDGNATYYMASGEKYTGAFVKGSMTGEGLLYRGNILLYEGNWLDGKMSGVGIVYDSGGEVLYSGNLRNNIPYGFGIKFINAKKQYQGNWVEGRRHGQGMLFDNEGHLTYMGDFVNDKKEGIGTNVRINMATWVSEGPNNQIISEQKETAHMTHGQYKNDKLFRASSEIKYIGEFGENKIPNGIGKLILSTGLNSSRLGTLNQSELLYEGSVKEGKRHGLGKEYEDKHLIYEGEYSNDLRSGAGKLFEYYGNMSEFTGSGTIIIKDVEYFAGRLISTKKVHKYIGDIVNGSMTGSGSLYELNSSSTIEYLSQSGIHVFSGNFKDGLRDGVDIK